jgi:hypothetical protein
VRDYTLGFWAGEAIQSPVEDEDRIQQLAQLLYEVFDRCEETLATTPHMLRYWLKGYHQYRFYPKPFQAFQRPESRRRYRGQWQRFLYFVLRTWRTEPGIRDDIYGVCYSALQETLLSQLWTALPLAQPRLVPSLDLEQPVLESNTHLDTDPLILPPSPARQQLVEWLFQFSYSFLTEISPSSNMTGSALVYFIDIYGIHSHSFIYRTAYIFIPILAGFIWIGRLLLLEYILPARPWEVLK